MIPVIVYILGVERRKVIRRWSSPSQQSAGRSLEEDSGELWLIAVMLKDVARRSRETVAHSLQVDAPSGHPPAREDTLLVRSG